MPLIISGNHIDILRSGPFIIQARQSQIAYCAASLGGSEATQSMFQPHPGQQGDEILYSDLPD